MFCNLFLWFSSKSLQYQLHFSIFTFKCKTSKLGLVKSRRISSVSIYLGSLILKLFPCRLEIKSVLFETTSYHRIGGCLDFIPFYVFPALWKTQGHEFCVIGIYRSTSYFCRHSSRAQIWTFKRHLTNKLFVILLQNMIF